MVYAIGDVHAQHTLLCALLDQLAGVPLEQEDTIVFLGDYIDRGNGAREVIETLMVLRDRHPRTVFLRGNHEQMMLDAYGTPPPADPADGTLPLSEVYRFWSSQGGAETLRSYRPDIDDIDDETFLQWRTFLPETHCGFLRATQMEYFEGPYHFVHAGVLPTQDTSWDYQSMGDPRLWIREPFLSSESDFGGKVIVFGHTPQMDSRRPLINANKLGLDTGAGCGGPLTAAALDPVHPITGHVVQVYQAYP